MFKTLHDKHLDGEDISGWVSRIRFTSSHQTLWVDFQYGGEVFYSQVRSGKNYDTGSLQLSHHYLGAHAIIEIVAKNPSVKPFVGLTSSLWTVIDSVELESGAGDHDYDNDGIFLVGNDLIDLGVVAPLTGYHYSLRAGLALQRFDFHHWFLGIDHAF